MATPTRAWVAHDLAGDRDIARRILAHIDTGTTDEGARGGSRVGNYLDPTRLADLDAAFLSNVYLPSGGAAQPREASNGEPRRAAVRGARPRWAGHGNTQRLRHTEMTLVEGPGCAQALSIAVAGWTYRLDGTLARPPCRCVPDLTRTGRGRQLRSRRVDRHGPRYTGPAVGIRNGRLGRRAAHGARSCCPRPAWSP